MVDKDTIIYPKESYDIIGAAYAVFNELGYGFKEVLYQRAFAEELKKRDFRFEKEKSITLRYDDIILGTYRLDFVVNDAIVVELKVRHALGYTHIKQVMGYLKSGNYKLALLIYFTKDGVKFRRVLNAT
jgi:GxxExxY protein